MQNLRLYILFFISLTFVAILLAVFTNTYVGTNCDDVKSSADEAYSNFKKAYYSNSLDDAHRYAKKGMSAASDSEDEADDSECDCDDAKNSSSDAYTYGKRAYNSYKLSDVQYYSKKAMNFSLEISDEAENCENE